MLTIQQRADVSEHQIDEAIYQYARRHRGCIPGVVVSVDTVGGNYTVRPAITEATIDPDTGVRQDDPLPDISMSKLAVFGAGGFNITFPVSVGDEGLLLFQDMCLDAAWQNGGSANPQLTKRRHDLSDSIFIPLSWSKPKKLANFSTTSVQLRNAAGDTVIDLTGGKVTITAGTEVQVVSPNVSMGASGGTPLVLLNNNFLSWVTTTLLTALAAHSITVTAPPATVVTTNVKAT